MPSHKPPVSFGEVKYFAPGPFSRILALPFQPPPIPMSVSFSPAWLALALLLGGCSDKQEKSRAELHRKQLDFSVDDYFKAVQSGTLSSVSAFLEAGMAVDVTDATGGTALMLAAESGQGYIVEELLSHKAQPNQARTSGDTPLILAARNGNAQALLALLKAGADPSAANQEGLSALAEAAMAGHASAVKILAPASRSSLDYALQLAAVKGRTDVLDVLLQQGANVLARSFEKRTSLMYAAINGQDDAVQLLMQRGSNLLAIDNELQTAAMLAESSGHPTTAAILNDPKEIPESPEASLDPTAPVPMLEKLADHQFPPPEPDQPVSQQLKFHSHRERQLPFLLQEVSEDNSTATVQMLTSEQEIVPLVKGDKVPGTDFIMIRANHALKPAKHGKGNLVDVSTLLIRDDVTGESVLAQFRQAVTTADSFGVIRETGTGTLYEVHAGDSFSLGSKAYSVLDVRPSQILIAETASRETLVLEK